MRPNHARAWPYTSRWRKQRLAFPAHSLNRKNCCVPEMGLVTVFRPLTITGAGRTAVQTGEMKFRVDCNVKPVKLVGQDKIILPSAGVIVSCGWLTGDEMLKTVPENVA